MGNHKRAMGMVIATALMLTGTGCGDDDDDARADAEAPADADDDATSATEPASEPARLDIAARGLTYELSPQSVPEGAVEVTLTNNDPPLPLPQIATLVKLDEGMTLDEYRAFFDRPDGELAAREATTLFGGPGPVLGGETSTVTVDLAAGTYAIASFMAGPDGAFNLAKGQLVELEVTSSARPAPLPEADQQVVMRDMFYELPSERLQAGDLVEVTNAGPQDHEFSLVKLADGATVQDVLAFFSSPPTGPPPFLPVGGVNGLSPDQVNHIVVPSEPGRYAAFCALGDVNGGPPHVLQGMLTELEVV